MTRVEIAKSAARWIVGISVGWTVRNVVRNNVDTDGKKQEAEAWVAGVALGNMAAQNSERWIDDKIDHYVALWNGAKDKIEGQP